MGGRNWRGRARRGECRVGVWSGGRVCAWWWMLVGSCWADADVLATSSTACRQGHWSHSALRGATVSYAGPTWNRTLLAPRGIASPLEPPQHTVTRRRVYFVGGNTLTPWMMWPLARTSASAQPDPTNIPHHAPTLPPLHTPTLHSPRLARPRQFLPPTFIPSLTVSCLPSASSAEAKLWLLC